MKLRVTFDLSGRLTFEPVDLDREHADDLQQSADRGPVRRDDHGHVNRAARFESPEFLRRHLQTVCDEVADVLARLRVAHAADPNRAARGEQGGAA